MNTVPRPTGGLLESRLEFEELIGDTSAALFATVPDGAEAAVVRALARVREFFGVDRCGLLQAGPDGRTVHVRVSANAPDVAAVPGDLDLAALFPWSFRQLFGERLPVRFTRLDDLPPAAGIELGVWRSMSVRSALILPLGAGGSVRHCIALNIVRHEYDWPEAFLSRLQVLGEMLAGALERQDLFRELRDTETRVSLAADAAEAGLWMLDFASGVFWVSPRARWIFGFAADAVVDLARIEASVHPEDREPVRAAIARARSAARPVRIEYRIRRGDEERWISSRGRTRFSPGGEPQGLMGLSIDVTERRGAEEAFRRSEARLESGAELAGLGFYELDFRAGTSFIDKRFRAVCGIPPSAAAGLAPVGFWEDHLHPGDRARIFAERERLHRGDREQSAVEYRYLHPAGKPCWIQHLSRVTARDASGRAIATFGVVRDITDVKLAESRLGDLSRRLLRAQEKERALLARELHDDVTQRLAALAIDVGRALGTAPAGPLSEVLRTVGDGLAQLSEDIHSLAYQLHPSVLRELGLVSALHTECERCGRRSDATFAADLEPVPVDLHPETALCLFRVAQEALNNVVRHAGARSATVTLRRQAGELLLSVRDDGAGFRPAGPGERRSLGLASMRERVRLVGGTLDIASTPGQGTTIIARVPLARGATP